MTDRWVSSKKHYCEVCRCWVAGSRLNIKNHESSARHVSALRNKMIESHKKQLEDQKQEEFERCEVDRLNNITLDTPIPLSRLSRFNPLLQNFTHVPLKNHANDLEIEKDRILQSINSVLSGNSTKDGDQLKQPNSRWISTIDQSTGTLIYYDKHTGYRTKIRPKGFDGKLTVSSNSLISDWTLKYDPLRKCQYYHNNLTGELRWLSDDPTLPKLSIVKPKSVENDLFLDTNEYLRLDPEEDESLSVKHADIMVKIEGDLRVKHDPHGIQTHNADNYSNAMNIGYVTSMPSDADALSGDALRGSDKLENEPEIGRWETVNPQESAFSHYIESIEPYIKQHKHINESDTLISSKEFTYKDPLLNDDDFGLVDKPIYNNITPSNGESVGFLRRKVPKKSSRYHCINSTVFIK